MLPYAIRTPKVSYFVERMRPSILASILSLGLLPSALAQYAIRGQVLDERGDLPLVGAHVRLLKGYTVAVADEKGFFELVAPTERAAVLVTHVGFQEVTRTLAAVSGLEERTIIRMRVKPVDLPVTEIRAPQPEVVFERKDLHVGDYLVNDDGLWVLVYGTRRLLHRQALAGQTVWQDARLHLLDTQFVEHASTRLPSSACLLVRDHAMRPVVKAERGAWLIDHEAGTIGIGWIADSTYQQAVIPWTDSLPGLLIGNTWSYSYPSFDHVMHDGATREQRTICTVTDEHWMAIFRSGYKYMSGRNKVLAMDLALEQGTDPEIVAGFMVGWDQDIRYRPPYAPLFVVRDTLCVFDHHLERIRRFDRDLTPIDEVPITYQRDADWDHIVVQDRKTEIVYSKFSKGSRTWLRPLEPSTGALGAATPLTHPWPKDVQVHDGYAYYVFRPYESLQKRTLYREQIR